jgi:hypothetical protein
VNTKLICGALTALQLSAVLVGSALNISGVAAKANEQIKVTARRESAALFERSRTIPLDDPRHNRIFQEALDVQPNYLKAEYIAATYAAAITATPETIILLADPNTKGISSISLVLALIAGGIGWGGLIITTAIFFLSSEEENREIA